MDVDCFADDGQYEGAPGRTTVDQGSSAEGWG